jgi:DNA-binding transcriptional LysR family regulator
VAANWEDLRYVLALHRSGSVAAAARSLRVDPSTIGRRIAALETALDVHIALRHADGMRLTEAGEAVAKAAVEIETSIANLTNRFGGGVSLPRGHVRIAATESTANLIYEGLTTLREEYPEITFELVVSSMPTDLSRGDADLAVRMFRETRGDLVARKIGEIGWSVYASPRYLERHPCASIDSFADHDLVGFADAPARSPGGVWLAAREAGARVVMRGTTVTTVMQSAMAGMGIAVLPSHIVDGSLVRLTDEVVATNEVFLVIPPTHRETARVHLVSDAIAGLFGRERVRFSGVVRPAQSCDPSLHASPAADRKRERE